MASLVRFVRDTVNPREYYEAIFPGIQWPDAAGEARVHSPWTKEKTPSLSLNPETGAWFSFSAADEFGGKSIVSFHSKYAGLTINEAASEIFHTHVHPVVSDKLVRKWRRALLETPSALNYLKRKRLLPMTIIEQYELGWNGTRFTIPIRNEFDLCINAKLYDPLARAQGMPKIINYKSDKEPRRFGVPPMLFPLKTMEDLPNNQLIVCEGEWDTLFLLSLGIPAVTSTAGSKSWPKQYNELFRALDVIVAYDNDEAGTKHARKYVVKNIKGLTKTIRLLDIPKLDGVKDVLEWAHKDPAMRKSAAWERTFEKAKVIVDNPESLIEKATCQHVSLHDTARADLFQKPITVDALISGKDSAPFAVPKRYRISCNQTCNKCPLAESRTGFVEKEFKTDDPALIGFTDISDISLKRLLFAHAGMAPTPECRAKCDRVETQPLELLMLIPTLDSSTGQYITRSAYFAGLGLQSNRAYRFEGITTASPKDQAITHLFNKARPVQDEIETFELTKELRQRLKVFQPKKLSLLATMMNLAEWQSRNITKIRERPDLHIAVDLAFHSPAEFNFNGEFISKAMLDILVLGDTRCGKGYVAERLSKFYGLGEVASGENCSFAGLIGGVQPAANGRWMITWGVLPLNNGRLVILDEAGALSHDEIGQMSRVRSEGIAELNKIVFDVTRAAVRMVWLGNPRSGRPLNAYNSGVEAIKEFVGANEDISRFDFALTVASDEVPSEIINSVSDNDGHDFDKYPRELSKALVLWAWSRKARDIHFSKAATQAIIDAAIEFGRTYSASIPLVQSENVRIKLAKISAAVAARLFSTDESGEKLLIEEAHVRCACEFLRIIYSKLSMSYRSYSRTAKAAAMMEHPAQIVKAFEPLGKCKALLLKGLLEMSVISIPSITDYTNDQFIAQEFIGRMVQLKCFTRSDSGRTILKNPSFNAWLREHIKGGTF